MCAFRVWITGLMLCAYACTAAGQDDDLKFLFEDSAGAGQAADSPSADSTSTGASQTRTSAPESASKSESAATSEPELDAEPAPDATRQPPAGSATAARVSRSRLVEEIVVTAQKREESLQDVPITIQAFSPEALEARGITEVNQLVEIVPGLQITDIVGFTQIYIRGVGTDSIAPSSDPSVAIYVDGVYVPAGHGIHQSLGGIKRVEVLKGPQGTLFGRNSTAGAVSIITEEPDPENVTLQLKADVGNLGNRGATFNGTTPVTDWLSLGVAAIHEEHDPFTVQTRFPDQTTLNQGGRIKLNFHPPDGSDTWELGLTYFKTNNEIFGGTASINSDPFPLGTALGIEDQELDRTSDQDIEGTLLAEQEMFYGFFDWKLPWFDVKVIAGDVLNFTELARTDFDGSPEPIAFFDARDNFSDYISYELQFLSNDGTWLSDKFEWVAGAFYTESEVGIVNGRLFLAPNFLPTFLQANTGVPQEFVDVLNGLPGIDNSPVGGEGIGLEFNGVLGTESISGFFNGTWRFTDWLHLILGGRYQVEKRFLIRSETNAFNPGGGETNLFNFPLESTEDDNFSPRVVINTFPTNDITAYASWSKGFKSATFNIISLYTAPDFVEAEEVTNIEIGIKSSLFGGLLRLNAAAFNINIENLQTGFVSLQAGGAVTLENAGEAEINGAEFDAILVPFQTWNPGLVITMNAAYLDSEYLDFDEGSGFEENSGVFADDLDFTGNEIVRAPEFSAGAGISQTFGLGPGEVELGVNGYYNSGFFFVAQNSVEQPAYGIVGANASYLYAPWNLRVAAFGSNLLDEEYFLQRFQIDFGTNSTLAAPRQYGLRASWQF